MSRCCDLVLTLVFSLIFLRLVDSLTDKEQCWDLKITQAEIKISKCEEPAFASRQSHRDFRQWRQVRWWLAKCTERRRWHVLLALILFDSIYWTHFSDLFGMCSPDSWFYDIFIFLKFHYEMQGNAPYRTCEARYVYADGSAYKGTWSGDSLDGEVHPQGAEAVGWSDWTESWIIYNSLLISWISSHCSTISAYLMMQFPLGRVLADGQAAWPQREEYRGPQPKWATLVTTFDELMPGLRPLLSWKPSSLARESRSWRSLKI